MAITIVDLQKKIALNPPAIKKMAAAVLRLEGITRANLSVVFVTAPKIKALNKTYLKRNYSTDVLSFASEETRRSKAHGKVSRLSGDVVISTDAVLKNARIFRSAIIQECALYIIHGILHLTGYDDQRMADQKKMRNREQVILRSLQARVKDIIKLT